MNIGIFLFAQQEIEDKRRQKNHKLQW